MDTKPPAGPLPETPEEREKAAVEAVIESDLWAEYDADAGEYLSALRHDDPMNADWQRAHIREMRRAILRAAIEAVAVTVPEPQAETAAFDGDELGRIVRDTWISWACEQPEPKAHWLVPYDQLSGPDRDVYRRIGQAIATHMRAALAERLARAREALDLYGQHLPGCHGNADMACTCGLDAARRAAGGGDA